MLDIRSSARNAPDCDGISRRNALKIGATGLIGGLSLPKLLELEANAATGRKAKATSCIMLFLEGGPSTIDMWDMKPEAASEIRGPYKPISTNVPGLKICEHLPACAKIADKYTILRSHSHRDNGHTTGYYYTLTGHKPNFADGQNNRVPVNVTFPSIGSWVVKELGAKGSVPPYVNLPDPMRAGGPGFLGAEYAPFVIETDPVQPDFQVKDIHVPKGLSVKRLKRRQSLLSGVEQIQRSVDTKSKTMSAYYQKAFDLITSPAAKKAFDIKSEPESVRKRYGHTSLGQCALMARRLVESGCRFVGVDHGSWDTHFTCFPSLENDLIPHADLAFSALVSDLEERGLLDSTLVIMMGEMGRTPRINKQAGRDHWSMAQSVLFAGGGTKPGIVGATDKHASEPTSEPVSIADLLRTVFNLMGIDSSKLYKDPLGRPVPIVNGGRFVSELV